MNDETLGKAIALKRKRNNIEDLLKKIRNKSNPGFYLVIGCRQGYDDINSEIEIDSHYDSDIYQSIVNFIESEYKKVKEEYENL